MSASPPALPLSVEPSSGGATCVSLASKMNATDLPVGEPVASRARVQEVVVDPKVLDLFSDDESLGKAEIASPLKMRTCEEVSRDDGTQMGLKMLKSGWVLREWWKEKREVCRQRNCALSFELGCSLLCCNAKHHVISIVLEHCIRVQVECHHLSVCC